jgi:secondary thiamine-phosphate synthase enzyme
METIQVKSGARNELIDITSQVEKVVGASGVKEGIAVVYVAHTTAGVTINESADPAVARDIIAKLSDLAPRDGDYRHMEGNSDAHIKASIMGSSVNLIITGGKIALGTWQGVFFCEFDGPRTRKALIKVVGS